MFANTTVHIEMNNFFISELFLSYFFPFICVDIKIYQFSQNNNEKYHHPHFFKRPSAFLKRTFWINVVVIKQKSQYKYRLFLCVLSRLHCYDFIHHSSGISGSSFPYMVDECI